MRILSALLLLAPLAAAGTLHVPQDFATIQAAVDASVDSDTIVVHKGTYAEGVIVSSKSGLLIKGVGKPRIDATGFDIGLALDGCADVEVRGLQVDGADQRNVAVSDSSDIELHHLELNVKNVASSTGLYLATTTGARVHHCHVNGALLAGIFVDTSSAVQLDHNVVFGMASGGWPEAAVRTADAMDVTIEHNTLSFVISGVRCFSDAPGGFGASDSTIAHNVIHDLWHAGIEAYGTGLLIEKNKVTGSGDVGIWLDADDTTVSHDKVSQAGDTGILVFDGVGNVLDHNTVSKAGFHGISSSATTTGTTLTGNKVTSSGGTASLSLEGTGCSSDQDRVTKPKGLGLVLSGTGGSVTGLRITKPAGVGLEISGGGNALSDARVSHAGADGFQVTGDGNTLADCRAMGSDEDGFDVSGTGNAFTTCKAKGSGTLDKNDGGTDNTFTDCDFGTESP
ncbi:MAG TPA: right-handed parallel beta-helix repeat-containing protein [Planctomycetota bacterium]|nr:right-handed parallel beta-helix repeat-containing protein [Planctomycetota bacterium]